MVGHFPRRTRLRGTIPDIAMLFGFQPLKDFFLSRSMEFDARFFSPSASQQCALGKNKAKCHFIPVAREKSAHANNTLYYGTDSSTQEAVHEIADLDLVICSDYLTDVSLGGALYL